MFKQLLINQALHPGTVLHGSTKETRRLAVFYKTLLLLAVFFTFTGKAAAQVDVTSTEGTPAASYATVNAAFVAINAGTHQGAITMLVTASTTEPAATALVASGQGSASYTSVLIRPTATVTISGAPAASRAILEFNGADNVTINGDIAGGSVGRDLTFINTAANTVVSSAIRLAGTTTGGLGATNITIENTVIIGNVDAANNSTTAQFGIYAAGTSTTTTLSLTGTGDNFDNLVIRNNEIKKAKVGIHIGGTTANQADGLVIEDNTIGSNTAADFVTYRGISVTGVVNPQIRGNTIFNIKSSIGGSSSGIEVLGTSTNAGITISRNLIYGIHNVNTGGWAANGINLNGGNDHLVVNNVLYDLKATNYFNNVTTFSAHGIRLTAGTGHKIYYNSVNIYGTVDAGTASSASVAFSVTSTGVTGIDVRNNIFQNKQVSTVTGFKAYAVRFASGYNFATSGLIMNNNAYFVPSANTATTSYFVGGTYATNVDAETLSAWSANTQQALATNDNNSIPVANMTAPFISDTDLSFPSGLPAEFESRGVAIAALGLPNTDFNGIPRPGGPFNDSANSAPDLGAFEFDGIPADLSPPTILYTALGSTCDSSARTLTATITDASGIPVAGAGLPVLYYRVNSGVYTAVTGVSIGDDQYTFTFGAGISDNDIVQYYIVAQDMNTTPNVGSFPAGGAAGFTSGPPAAATAPASPSSYNSFLNGTYEVGVGKDFATVTAALAAYNGYCITGHVTFVLTDAAYPSETFPLAINSNIYAAADKTLTIKPGTGVDAIITGSNSNAILRLNGADYVTIDGSNNGSTSRNLTIANTNTGTSSVVIYLNSASASNGATNNTIKNLNIAGNSPTTTFSGIVTSSSATLGGVAEAANNNNTYHNNVVSGVTWGIALVGPTGNESGTVVTNNIIGGTTAATRIGLRGIAVFQQQGVNVSGNTVSGVYTATTTIASGIYIAGTHDGGTITRNVVSDIRNTNSGGYGANGIQLAASTTASNLTVSNNFIYDVAGYGYASGMGENDNGYGMLVSAGGGYKIYHNSISHATNQTTATYLSAAMNITSTVTTPNSLDIRNNIFYNGQTTGAQRYSIYSGAPATVFEFINNNDYFTVNGPNLGFLGSMRTNLAAWKTATGKDALSRNQNPNFISATNLHITAGPSELESKGAVLAGITTDIDGDTRPGPAGSVNGGGTAPDIGADEFDGIPADLTAPEIVYTPLIPTCSTTNRTLVVTINDESGIPTSGAGLPVLYYRINAGAYTAVQGVSTGNNQYEFTFGGGVTVADVVSYYVVAQDDATTPNIAVFPAAGAAGFTASPPAAATAPTTPSSYAIQNTMQGDYTVGVGGDYTTITAAVNAYNTRCITGAVTFLLTDAAYGAGETFPIVVNANAYASSENTLTIRPAAGNTAAITGSNAGGIIKLNGADYVTIDGSNNGTSSQNLSITNNSASASSVVWIASMGGAGNGARNNTVKNVIVTGGAITSGIYGIVSSATTSLTTSAEDNDNLIIQNNSISKAYIGISALTSATPGLEANGLVIANNSIGSNTATNIITQKGIQISNAVDAFISGNNIFNMKISGSLTNMGIDIIDGVINGQVVNNVITGIHSTSTSGYGAYGINFSSGTGTTGVLVANNSISDLRTANYSATSTTFNAFGIRITGGTNLKVYYNSINMYGPVTGGASSGLSANMVVTTAVSGLDVRNNIFSITQVFTANNSAVYNIYLAVAGLPDATINFNNYYGTSSASTAYRVGYSSTPKATLADWAAFTGQDANSMNVAPVFVSDTDLHLVPLSNGPLNNMGTPIAAVTTDIDGDTRGATATDMGIDEFVGPACTTAEAGTASTTTVLLCGSGSAVITNTGFSIGETSTYMWESSTDNFATPGTATGVTTPQSFTTGNITVTTSYRLRVACGTDESVDYTNVITIPVNQVPTAVASANTSVCTGETINLVGTSDIGTTFSWTGPDGFTSTDQSPSIANATMAATGTYTFTAAHNGCSTSGTVDVVVNVTPAVPVIVATVTDICGDETSDLSATAAFSATVPVLSQDFNSGLSTWTVTNNGTANTAWQVVTPVTYNSGFNVTNYSVDGTLFAFTNSDIGGSGSSTSTALVSPSFSTVGYDSAIVNFDHAFQFWASGSNASDPTRVDYSIDGGSTWTQLKSYTANTAGTPVPVNESIVLPVAALGQEDVKIRFLHQVTWGYYWAVDNVVVTAVVPTPDYEWTLVSGDGLPDDTDMANITVNPTMNSVYMVTARNPIANACSSSETIEITVTQVAVSADQVICNGDTATLTATGADTYVWMPGGFTTASIDVSPEDTTVYTVSGTVGACVTTASTTVTVNQLPTASITAQTNVGCFGEATGQATVTAAGGMVPYTYSWSGGAGTTDTATGLSAGSYTVTITDNNGCITTATAVITEPALAVSASVSSQTNVGCFGQATGEATVTAAGGTTPYTYLWSGNGGTSATATGLSAGTHTVTVTDANGCETTASTVITQPALALSASMTSVNDVTTVGGSDGSALVTAAGGTAPYTYSWNTTPEQTTAAATGLAPGFYVVTITDANGCTTTASTNINSPNCSLILTTTQGNVSCFGGANGYATATTVNGTAPYSYSWSNGGGTSATASNLAAGTYIVTVTDAIGCTTSGSVTITQPAAALAATVSASTNVSCFGGSTGSATVTVTGGTGNRSYSWNTAPAQTTATATGLAAGTYTVTVTDSNNCTTTATITITQPAAALTATVSAQTNINCFGGATGSATVSASGGTGAYSYSWNTVPVQTTATATGLSAGTYTVTVTDANGCVRIASVTITQPATPLSASVSAQSNVNCFGGSTGSATAFATGGTGAYSYSWNTTPAQTTATATGLAAGTYIVTITDANGCTATATAVIAQPAAALAATVSAQTNVGCFGGSTGSATVTATGGTGNRTYSWNTAPVQTTATATGLSAGIYTVTVTDSNGCTTTATVTITQPAAALTATVSAQTNVNCFGSATGSATVTAAGGTGSYSYSWNTTPAQTTATATGLSAGTYTVTVTDANGCIRTASVTITQPSTGLMASVTAQSNVNCFGSATGTATAMATGGSGSYSYSWNTTPVQTTAIATGLASGSYTVTVTDANGCTATATVTITQPAAAVSATVSTQANVNCFGNATGSATVTAAGGAGGYSYSWNSIPVQTTATATGLAAGSYTVTVTDANGCTATATVTITQPAAAVSASIAGTNAGCSGASDGSATVTAAGGTGAYSYSWNTIPVQTTVTATGLAAGTYTVTVTDANGCMVMENITITEPLAVVINAQPDDVVTTTGSTVNFMVDAANADSYQWQVSTNDIDWNDVADGGDNPSYSGANTDTLTLTDVSTDLDGYLYRVILTNGANCTTTSSTAMLLVSNAIEAVDDDFSDVVINEGTGGVAGDVTANDMLNGSAVNDADVTITVTDDGGLTGVTIDADGNVTVPATAVEGTYTITYSICEVSDPANCSTAQVTIVVSPDLKVDGIRQLTVSIYPNPGVSEVFINIPDMANHRNLKVAIYDMRGRLVKQQLIVTETERVDISGLEEGIYNFSITSDSGSLTKRIVKTH